MSRTLHELLGTMKRLTKGLPDAYRLVRRLEQRLVAIPWDDWPDFDPDVRYTILTKTRRRNPVFLVFLPEGSKAPSDDSLVWLREVLYSQNNKGQKSAPALFVDAVPCHDDWLALKAFHEYGLIEIEETTLEIEQKISQWRDLPVDALAYLLARPIGRLHLHQEVLLSRLVDRGLRGRITSRVRTLKEKSSKIYDEKALAHKLIDEIKELLPHTWPTSANREEHHARYELIQYVARSLIFKEFRDEIVLS